MKRMSKNAMVALVTVATAFSLTGCGSLDGSSLKNFIEKTISESGTTKPANNSSGDTARNGADESYPAIEKTEESSAKAVIENEGIGFSAKDNETACVYGPPEMFETDPPAPEKPIPAQEETNPENGTDSSGNEESSDNTVDTGSGQDSGSVFEFETDSAEND